MNEGIPRSYQQVKDIIHILRRVHEEMSQLCKTAAGDQEETKLTLLLKRLAERQQQMVEFFDTSETDEGRKIRETWIQFVPSEHLEQHLHRLEALDAGPGEIPYQIQEIQHDISELISVIIEEESDTEKARDFMQSLADRELAEAKQTSEAIVELDDL